MKDYKTHKGIECLNSCLYNHILNKGYPITGSDIFFLGHGLNITYTGHLEEKMIYSEQYESNHRFLKQYLPKSLHSSLLDVAMPEMKSFLVQTIREEKALILMVSSPQLSYNKVFQKNITITHFINVIDYNADKRAFLVSDGCPPVLSDEVYEDWLDEQELLDSWESMGSRYVILNFDNNRLDEAPDKSAEEFVRQLEHYVKGRNRFIKSKYKGYRSVATLLKDMIPLFEHRVPEISPVVMNVHRQLKINGFLQSKEFILDKAKDLQLCDKICQAYHSIIEQWNREMMILIKTGIKADMQEFLQLIERIEILTDKEKNLQENMLRFCQNPRNTKKEEMI